MSTLRRIVAEVRNTNRDDLLTYKTRGTSTKRVPLVLSYHHKFTGIKHVLRSAYYHMVQKHPQPSTIFPEPPLVS